MCSYLVKCLGVIHLRSVLRFSYFSGFDMTEMRGNVVLYSDNIVLPSC